jgi:hypothetical protein
MPKDFLLSGFKQIMNTRYPDVEDGGREHPMTAVGIVLLAMAMGGITGPVQLAHFTLYQHSFVSGIIFNLMNNRVWKDRDYDASGWLSAEGHINDGKFWDHIAVASGEMWFPEGDVELGVDVCEIYWAESRRRQDKH